MAFTPGDLEKADARLAYLVTNKVPVTAEEIKALITRVFTGSFIEECGHEKSTIQHLVSLLYDLNVAAAEATAENEDRDAVEYVEGNAAESLYVATAKTAYLENGFDANYAEEAASWHEVLPMNANWDPELLTSLARLEVGHDLVVMDVIKNMTQARQEQNCNDG